MERNVTVKKWYVVSGTAGDTVTSPDGSKIFCTVPEGGQGIFYATSPKVVTSDDSVEVVETNFNSAPVKLKLLGLLGGGVSTGLPSGYLAAEFLESTGTQYIKTGVPDGQGYSLNVVFLLTKSDNDRKLFGGTRTGLSLHGGQFRYNVKSAYVGMRYLFEGAGEEYQAGGGMSLPASKATVADLTTGESTSDFFWVANQKANASQISLFAIHDGTAFHSNAYMRLYYAKVGQNGEILNSFAPALDTSGVPCMHDYVNGENFYNSGTGSFIVGMNMKQARKLGKLPAGGGTLTVSLPSNYLEDEGVTNAIADANVKGWNIKVASTFEADGASATFALRRIWVRKTQGESGSYIDSDGVRWMVESCVAMYNADGSEPDAHGYEPFRSVEVATEYWGLTPWVDPETETELLTEYENE